jgi:hypothetical protein
MHAAIKSLWLRRRTRALIVVLALANALILDILLIGLLIEVLCFAFNFNIH